MAPRRTKIRFSHKGLTSVEKDNNRLQFRWKTYVWRVEAAFGWGQQSGVAPATHAKLLEHHPDHLLGMVGAVENLLIF